MSQSSLYFRQAEDSMYSAETASDRKGNEGRKQQ